MAERFLVVVANDVPFDVAAQEISVEELAIKHRILGVATQVPQLSRKVTR